MQCDFFYKTALEAVVKTAFVLIFLLCLFIAVGVVDELKNEVIKGHIGFKGYKDFIVTERQTSITNKSQFSVVKTINRSKK